MLATQKRTFSRKKISSFLLPTLIRSQNNIAFIFQTMSHKVFVYGTLKQGEPNYDVLETGRGQGLSDFDATMCGHGL